ncbi:2-octaprenyl-6-methoxyphenyl hydroxylase [Gammaproteobacteria bacterium]|nr:2-octaprenyl-6-methoxyphenyl hydroxylase [Gammaproteobacteria bacterium]HAS47789.1 2-octaprenyl-6-methoxyphenyl hydroxylase [Gammaproteobacteria bacterium]
MQISNPDKFYDLVVVGAGMVGASFCCALENLLRESPISVLVIEAIAPNNGLVKQSSFDARSTALSFGSRKIFEEFAVWQELGAAVSAIDEIQVSDRGRLGAVSLSAQEQKVDALGYVVENKRLGEVLNARLLGSDKINLLSPAAVSSIKATEGGMQLRLQHGDSDAIVDTSLVVLADGGKSPVCGQLGISQSIERYDQHALIANIVFEKPHNNIAYERFTDTGPLAILPLQAIDGTNRGSLVWTLSVEQAAEFREMYEEQLLSLLQERFGFKLGKITNIGERFVYPLSLSLAKEQVRPGLALLGNVAHTLHPVAGQGLNLALRDARVLVDVLGKAMQQEAALGDMSMLSEYVARQEADQALTTQFTHNITKLFSSNNDAKVWLRKFGLLAIELSPRVRHSLAERAMGLS